MLTSSHTGAARLKAASSLLSPPPTEVAKDFSMSHFEGLQEGRCSSERTGGIGSDRSYGWHDGGMGG